jgi:kynureninase
VIPDFRPPNVLRLGPAPAYTRFVDVWDAMDRLRKVMDARAYERFDPRPGRVT